MPHYACTNQPWNVYCPTCKGRFQCKGDLCAVCNNLCENFDPGDGCDTCATANASLCDPAFRFPTDKKVTCIMWKYRPGICLPRLQVIEGSYSPLATYFLQKSPNGSALTPDAASATVKASTLIVTASAKWGWLDIFGLLNTCGCDVLSKCYRCEFDSADGTSASMSFDSFHSTAPVANGALHGLRHVTYTSSAIAGSVSRYITLQMEGSFRSILNAMLNMTFLPDQYFNSFRVRHLLLAPTPTKTQVSDGELPTLPCCILHCTFSSLPIVSS